MKIIGFIAFLFSTLTAFSQQNEVEKRLNEYGVRVDFLEHSIRNTKETYTYKYRMTYGDSNGRPIINESEYDPRRPMSQRWQLLTVNNHPPAKKELKKWNRLNNERAEEMDAEIDKSSYEIVVDNPVYFSYSFKYKEGSVSSNRKFLEDCIGYVYIEKASKKVTGIRYESIRETKVGLLNCSKLVINHDMDYDAENDIHLLTKEDFDMVVLVLGQETELQQVGEYYDYNKIK